VARLHRTPLQALLRRRAEGRRRHQQTRHLCWAYDNAYLSLNGKAGELVPSGTDTWKLKSDDGTKIDRLHGDSRNNGAHNDEYWRVTTPDGTRYYFGCHRLAGWTDGNETTDSTWTVPVYGDDSEEPCHADTFADSLCQQGWRWNLDYVVDAHDNALTYFYDKEENYYGRNLEAEDGTPYVRGGTLDRIQYGLKSSSLYTTKPLAKVIFTNSERCLSDSPRPSIPTTAPPSTRTTTAASSSSATTPAPTPPRPPCHTPTTASAGRQNSARARPRNTPRQMGI
jgi:hypothetical protein